MTWKQLIQQQSSQPYYHDLLRFLQEDGKFHQIYPPHSNVFDALKLTTPSNVKVVILGMDPYHGPGQAHGLSFSVPPGVDVPPSLRNIFQELKNDLGIDSPSHGCLIDWAKQGVLLLNTVLTVRQGQAGSHRNRGWEFFTDAVITHLNQMDRPLVYLLWGNFARDKKELITNPQHLVLEAAHPSPLSAYKGWFGCKHFSQANRFLSDHQIAPIDWRIE
jgi:uracil-DNA glycosylase